MRAKAPGDSEKEKWWRAALIRLAASGVGVKEFCRREGLNHNTYSYWRTQIKKRDLAQAKLTAKQNLVPVRVISPKKATKRSDTAKQNLVPVRVIPPQRVSERSDTVNWIEIRTNDGMEIRVPLTCNADVVGELVARLRGKTC